MNEEDHLTFKEKVFADEQFQKDTRRKDFNEQDFYIKESHLFSWGSRGPLLCFDFEFEGKKMTRYFYFGKYNVDNWLKKNKKEEKGDFKALVSGSFFL